MDFDSSSGKINVLFIDDSRVVRVAAMRMFDKDFDVKLGVDGVDGLAILERDPSIHVVFTDLAMPEMDGFELLEAIRSHTDDNIRDIPVIVTTGAGNPESAKKKAFSLGATDFVTKPFNGTDIKARACSYAKMREQNKSLKEKSTIDGLTGLLNFRGISMQLEKEISFAARHDASLTMIAIEVDNYKDLFVRIGRQGTEKVVKRVARILEDTFRKEDSIARVSLARYVVSMPMVVSENALDMASRICHTIESLKARLDGKRIKITVSIGLSSVEVRDNDLEPKTLIGLSIEAMNRALAAGASQIHEMDINEYMTLVEEQERKMLSIDYILDQIDDGHYRQIAKQSDAIVERLAPLLKLLSDDQLEKLAAVRKKRSNNVVDFSVNRNNKSR